MNGAGRSGPPRSEPPLSDRQGPASAPAPAPTRRTTGYSRLLARKASAMVESAICRFLPDDVVDYDAAVYPLPSDAGWAPSVFIYVMVQPVGDADGAHVGQFTSPYQLDQELIDTYVRDFAEVTVAERQRIRDLRAGGATESLGVALDDTEPGV